MSARLRSAGDGLCVCVSNKKVYGWWCSTHTHTFHILSKVGVSSQAQVTLDKILSFLLLHTHTARVQQECWFLALTHSCHSPQCLQDRKKKDGNMLSPAGLLKGLLEIHPCDSGGDSQTPTELRWKRKRSQLCVVKLNNERWWLKGTNFWLFSYNNMLNQQYDKHLH